MRAAFLSVSLLFIALAARSVECADPPRKPLVLAAYYIWYEDGRHPTHPWRGWTRDDVKDVAGQPAPARKPGEPPLASTERPLAGLYSSGNRAVAAWPRPLASMPSS
jgi:hypothetical protein